MSGIIWITGLPGTGKTRLADAVAEALRAHAIDVARVDGDALRRQFGASTSGFDRDSRIALGQRYVAHALRLAAAGKVVVASVVALFDVVRGPLRDSAARYLEVWLRAPEAIRLQRSGDRNALDTPRMGADMTPEFPRAAHLVLNNDDDPETIDRLALQIVAAWCVHNAV